MQKVFKYPVIVSDTFKINIPECAQVLSVQVQKGNVYLWVMVDPEQPIVERKFRLAGTGHPIEETNLDFIGTFQFYGGDLVFHLFEILS